MKSKIIQLLLITVISSFIFIQVQCDAVCDERTLLMEIRQDIEDNGILDCLRIVQPPHNYQETIDEKNKRIAAQWDTDCSFEAEYDWMKPLREIHGISNLVDDTGDIVERDFDDQADMCEIVRAAIAGGKFSKVTNDLANIPLKILDLIDCPGSSDQSEICAASGSSFYQKDSWLILLEGTGFNADEQPHFVIKPEDSSFPDIPEVQKNVLKGIEKSLFKGKGILGGISGALKGARSSILGALANARGMLSGNKDNKNKESDVDEKELAQLYYTDNRGCTRGVNSNKWEAMQFLTLRFSPKAKESLVFSFGMNSVKFESQCHLVQKLLMDGTEQLDTRSLRGNYKFQNPISGYVSQIKKGDHKIQLDYRTPCFFANKKQICPSSIDTDNTNIAALLLDADQNKFYKKIAAAAINMEESDKWKLFPNIYLDFELEKKKNVLFFYNTAFGGSGKGDVFSSRIKVDGKQLRSSTYKMESDPYVGAFGLAVKKLDKGKHSATVDYMITKTTNFNPTTADWQSAAISGMELPESSKIHQKLIENQITLSTGGYQPISSLKLSIDCNRKKIALVWFQIAPQESKEANPLAGRITVDGNEIWPSRGSSTDSKNKGVMGLAGIKLTPGPHEFNVEYKTEEILKVDPNDPVQMASITVIEFEG